MQSKLSLLALIPIILLVFLMPVNAQASYQQPLEGVYWEQRVLNVKIAATPTDAYSIVKQALQSWNEAQTWFIANYEPQATGKPDHTFVESDVNTQITIRYVSTLPNSWGAETTFDEQTGPALERVTISVILSVWSNAQLLSVMNHELGHALGLGHTELTYDLMYHSSASVPIPYPSTLNLYAIYVLTRNSLTSNNPNFGKPVTLPASIPYVEWRPGMAVPEFSFTPVLILLVTFLTIAILRKDQRFR